MGSPVRFARPALRAMAQRQRMAGTILALVFFIMALLVPVKYARLIADPPLEISQQVEDLHEQIDVLESEYILSPQQAENKREELDRIAEQASGLNPSKPGKRLINCCTPTNKSPSNKPRMPCPTQRPQRSLILAKRWRCCPRFGRPKGV